MYPYRRLFRYSPVVTEDILVDRDIASREFICPCRDVNYGDERKLSLILHTDLRILAILVNFQMVDFRVKLVERDWQIL